MAINRPYAGPGELPAVLPLFPLEGALLLPRSQLPLNIFEPRYLAMVDAAIAGSRLIAMIQPEQPGDPSPSPKLVGVGCAGRITEFSESGDGRYFVTLTGVARFRLAREIAVDTPYRQAELDFTAFADDFTPDAGAGAVDRTALLRTLAAYLDANKLEVDWDNVKGAPNEALVNGLAMMSPYGAREKQALLEARDLKTRAEMLIAITEMALARTVNEGDAPLQ
ncbi:LON peptidase substrate-binding domain-containing protein [Ancylobacter terrae]|uniref:LON peptidase substrate-binding domain-containing protein n=1 Tax=Ancylobacter sp. sgz301288 TaxID=3342077 RepID=UPI00385A668A